MSKAKLMHGNAVEISLISFGLAPQSFVLGTQLAPGKKRLVCIPALPTCAVC